MDATLLSRVTSAVASILILTGSLTVATSRADATDDEVAVRHAVAEYVAGWRTGDVERLSKVFALDHGYVLWESDGEVQSRSFRKLLEKRKPNPGYGEPYKILSLEIHSEVLAFVTVRVERVPRGSYINHFTLHKVGEEWRITTKTFVWQPAVGTDPAETSHEASWKITGPGRKHFAVDIDPAEAASGTQSLRLRSIEPQTADIWAAVEGVINIRPWRGERLQVIARVKTADAQRAALWARVDGSKDGNYVTWGWDTMSGRDLVGTTDWQDITLVLPAPEGATMLVMGSKLYGEGAIWIDDIRLAPVGDDVPLTSESEVRVREVPYREPPHLQRPIAEVTFED